MMKTAISTILLTVSIFFVSGCKRTSASIEIKVNGETIAQCSRTRITKLSPKNGGFRFHCGNTSSSIYVIYNTRNPSLKGNIARLGFFSYKPKIKINEKEYTYLNVTKPKINTCTIDKKLTSAKPSLGSLENGTYTMPVYRPCGKLEIILGNAKD